MVSAQDKMPAELKPGAVFRIDYDEIDEFEGRAKKFRIGDEDQSTFQLSVFRAAPTASARKTTR